MKRNIILVILLLMLSAVVYVTVENNRIAIREYTYASDEVPASFNGYRICAITDFHNGDNYEAVYNKAKKAKPDIICLVGDIVDMYTSDFTNTKELAKRLVGICDVYYSYGNHEMWSSTANPELMPKVETELKSIGVKFLNDGVKTIEKDGSLINIIGYGDEIYNDFDGNFQKHSNRTMQALYNTLDKTVLSVALFHRAQYFDVLSDIGYDVVISGHLHGGHAGIKYIREYILESHFATSEYIKGEYKKNNSVMYVSGGLANHNGIPRLFNTPEIVVLELESK